MNGINEAAWEWWSSRLAPSVRTAMVCALYMLEHNNNPTNSWDKEVARLQLILESGEGRWEQMYKQLQQKNSAEAEERQAYTRSLRQENQALRDEIRAVRNKEANVKLRGMAYEARMELVIREAFPSGVYENVSTKPNAGDGLLLAPLYSLHRCMFEFKAHSKAVRDLDVAKLSRDLDSSEAAFALMLTRTANVCGRRDFDVECTPLGKPMLFLVRTNDCGPALGSILKLALRQLSRMVSEEEGGGGGATKAQSAQAFGRIYRRMRTRLTQFRKQCELMQEGLMDGLADLKELTCPPLTPARLQTVLTQQPRPLTFAHLQDALRHAYPGTTKRQLLRLLRQLPPTCSSKVLI